MRCASLFISSPGVGACQCGSPYQGDIAFPERTQAAFAADKDTTYHDDHKRKPYDIDIACSLSAIEQQERGKQFEEFFAKAEEVAELAEGYALRLPNRDPLITRAVELIIAERKCCPFFGFTLVFDKDGGPVWLHLVGPGQVKSFIGEQMVPVHLRASPRGLWLNRKEA